MGCIHPRNICKEINAHHFGAEQNLHTDDVSSQHFATNQLIVIIVIIMLH